MSADFTVRQAASIHTAHLRGTGRDERSEIGRQAMLVSGTVGAVAAVLLCVTAPWIMAAFGTGPQVAHEGALFLRCSGSPYSVRRSNSRWRTACRGSGCPVRAAVRWVST
ncbi:hypothetical protein SAMN05216489_03087 [Streptomyces sp. 3213]|nr:hypothetical protein SAMN05216489_03087 [Streptomyces sp. 3213] [Streptomyces sp. 3213.3]